MKLISYLLILILLVNQIAFAQLNSEYVVGENDVLEVSFWNHPELSTSTIVLPDGSISYPVIGEVYVKGKTVDEIAKEMSRKFTAYYKNPVISVTLRSRYHGDIKEKIVRVTILGEVRFPDTYEYKEGAHLTEYIADAGGFTLDAEDKKVIIIRATESGEEKIKVNVKDILKNGGIDKDIIILPKDRIYVPRRSGYYFPHGWAEWGSLASVLSSFILLSFYIKDLRGK